MKLHLFLILIIGLSISACAKSDDTKKSTKALISAQTHIPYEGIWTRSFELGAKDSTANVYYRISDDQIEYEMNGPMSVKYTITKDTFLQKDNRWVGKLHDNQYVIFVKDHQGDSISLLKMKVKSYEDALSMEPPSENARSQFTSWNVFYKTSSSN